LKFESCSPTLSSRLTPFSGCSCSVAVVEAEISLLCQTTDGVVVDVGGMGLMELPSELFRMKNVTTLFLIDNNLCSLPNEIAHLRTLEWLHVRVSKGLDREI
jgi:Leucine-rich repeat (LRR) protein